MNVLAIYVANEIIQSRLDESLERLMAQSLPSGPSLRDRIASAATGLRSLLAGPGGSAGVPKLEDYPYRS